MLSISKISLTSDSQVTDISFASEKTGFATTSYSPGKGSALILKTTDAGDSWSSMPVTIDGSTAINIRSVYAKSIDSIYITFNTKDNRCGVCISSDGGKSWRSLISSTQILPYGGIIVHDKNIFVSKGNRLIKSSDSGKSWIEVYAPNGMYTGVGRPLFTSKNVGYAYGIAVGDCGGTCPAHGIGTFIKTNDGGNTWVEINSLPDPATHLNFIDDNNGYAFTFGSKVYKTTDGGQNWTFLKQLAGGTYFSSVIVNNKIYFGPSGPDIFLSSLNFNNLTSIYHYISSENFSFKAVQVSNNILLFLSPNGSVLKINLNQ